jgi:hypothetical protein
MSTPFDVIRAQAQAIRTSSAASLEQIDAVLTEHDIPHLRALRLMLLSLSEQCGAITATADSLPRTAPPPRVIPPGTMQRLPTFDPTPATMPTSVPALVPVPVADAQGDILPIRPNGGT